jgi:hypothetical protein
MNEIDKMLEDLILLGAIQVAGVDGDSGELLYSFTPKIKEVSPELFSEHLNSVNSEIMGLWEKGFININFMHDDPLVALTEKSFDNKELSVLNKREQWSILELKRLLINKEN